MATKHQIDPNFEDKDIEGLSVSYSVPTYTGNGGNRVGSTTVTLTFTLKDGTTVTINEAFSNMKATTSKDYNYTIGYYDVAVRVTVTTAGTNSSMKITNATAEITNKVVID